MLKTEDIKNLFIEKYKNKDYRKIGNAVQQSLTIELQAIQFEVDKPWIIREPNYNYFNRELEWYKSESLNVNDIPGGAPEMWRKCASPLGYINSNYGYHVFHRPIKTKFGTIKNQWTYAKQQLLNDKDCICSSSFEHYMNFRGYRKVLPKDIAFEYGPQINACGRMGEANTAIEFLLRDTNLTDIYNQVVILNEERKQKTKDLFIEALPQINENNLVHIIVSNDAGGCAGLLANKIMTEYNRPAIVFTKHKNMYSGSARSIEGLDLQNIFHHLKLQNYITSFGGHESACGVELTEEQFKDFQNIMNSVIYNILLANSNVEVKEPSYVIDKVLKAKEINNKTLDLYKDLLFYGTLNPPKFYIDNVEIDDVIHSTNNENNIKFYFKDESGKSNAWCWGFGETYEKLGSPKKVNIVFELEPFFNGQVVIKIDEMEAAI